MKCTNCKKGEIEKDFLGVPVCANCNAVGVRLIVTARQDLDRTIVLYKELLREAAVKGKLHFPELPKPGGMPYSELRTALKGAIDANNGSEVQQLQANDDGSVQPDLSGRERDAAESG